MPETIKPTPKQASSLNPSQRSPELQTKVDRVFKSLNSNSRWGYNGAKHYSVVPRVDEHELFKQTIIRNPQKKCFTILDIGAGEWEFCRALRETISECKDIPDDVRINFISVRAEINHENETRIEEDRFYFYELGAFKVENILEEFVKRDLNFVNKIDMVVSSMCFRHLVDPLGTMLQALSLLVPKTGLMLTDGFYFGFVGQQSEHLSVYTRNIQTLLTELNVPYLLHNNEYFIRQMVSFIINRPDEEAPSLDWKYSDHKVVDYREASGGCVVVFQRPQPEIEFEETSADYYGFYGDLNLLDYLNQLNCFSMKEHTPLQLGSFNPSSLVYPQRFFKSPESHRLVDERHTTPDAQHKYDQIFGLIPAHYQSNARGK